MFIVCNENEAGKKQLKKNHKILVSHHLQDVDETQTISHLTQLIPSVGLLKSYMNGDISKKKYIRKYVKTIENNDELYASLVMLILAHENSSKDQEKRAIALVVSGDEMQFGYIQTLAMYIQDNFGIPFITYKEWKKREFKLKKYKINEERLSRDVRKHKTLLFDSYDEYKDTKDSLGGKGKKKKSKKIKNKDKKKKNKKNKKSSFERYKESKETKLDKSAEFEFERMLSKRHVMRIKKTGKKTW